MSLLSAEECDEVYRFVLAMQDMWSQRQPPEPFYTLGLATYLDATNDEDREAYYAHVRYPNIILSHSLGWLYERIAACLHVLFRNRVRYRSSCALPGFHIFTGVPRDKSSGIHFDRQHHQLTWSEEDRVDFSQTVSFTLSIRLPTRGAGLNVWNNLPDDIPMDDRATWSKTVAGYPSEFHSYVEGTMIVHAGALPHQLVLGEVAPGQERVTMQGHGVLCGEEWQLYW